MLAFPVDNAPIRLCTDTSHHGYGAVLEQMDDQWFPLELWSCKLTPTKMNYSAFNAELLTIYLGVCHFCHILMGWTFSVLLDHCPLSQALL